MKNLLLVLLFAALSTPVWGTFSLRVGDPRFGVSTQQGTIEEAVLSIKPKGLYLEYGLYLTFSARGTTYGPADSLEVTLKFDLPAGAIVHDSWLWIYNDIVRAAIMDRWTASSIYEGIVNRRQDPSVLFKTSATQHELRVFPMRGDERRKIKITYLMPAAWNAEIVSAELPISILKTSKNQVALFHVLTWPEADWQNPAIPDRPSLTFAAEADSVFGQYYTTKLAPGDQISGLRFAFDSPLKDGDYLRFYGSDQSGIYQLAMLPNRQLDYENKRKILILLDHDVNQFGTISASMAMEALRSNLKSELAPSDSFNIIVSSLTPQMVSADWLPADLLSLETALTSAETLLASYSNLPTLLAAGIEWMKTNGSDGTIFLATNSIQYGSTTSANPLLQDLMAIQSNPPIPIHVLHYHNSSAPYHFINGGAYYGSEYFLLNIAKLTGGDFNITLGYGLAAATATAVTGLGTALRSYDFHTTMDEGFCYGRFDLGTVYPDKLHLNKPVLQVGRYQGDLPFKIQFAGELNGQFISEEVSLDAGEIGEVDSLTREMWYGNYIRLLESGVQSNSTISEVVENSIAERVLSRYTAFLCLEDASQLCPTCQDESQLVKTTDDLPADSVLRAWPNPFTDQVTMEVRTNAAGGFAASAALEIYTADGRLVRLIRLAENRNDVAVVVWDGRDSSGIPVPPGGYIAVARTGSERIAVVKLVKKGA
jgi:hypothetical protein